MSENAIYVVEDTNTGERWVVVAESARIAVAIVSSDDPALVVGRLGDYSPGEMGARMTLDFPVVARQK